MDYIPRVVTVMLGKDYFYVSIYIPRVIIILNF